MCVCARQTITIRAAWVGACDRTCQFARAVMRLTPAEGALCAGTLTLMVTEIDGVGCPRTVTSIWGSASWLARGRTVAALHET